MDEQPVQLVKETRPPMAATPHRPRRVDYGVRTGGHRLGLLVQRTAGGLATGDGAGPAYEADWAVEVAGLLEGRYAACPRVTLVCDNLNTHTKGAFYEVFELARARQLVRRLEFC